MMICERCHAKPATVHVTKIINGEKTELNLCQQCASELGEFKFGQTDFFNLLGGVFKELTVPKRSETGHQCPNCGMTYAEFAQGGLFGCSQCYEAFSHQVDNVVRQIHGAPRHTGKVPARRGGSLKIKREIEKLRQELQQAVAREEFEKAAKLRDQIRELEQREVK